MKNQLSLVIAGEVDHGKSSILGRILEDTGAIPLNRIEAVKKICAENGREFEHSFLLDAFEEEQRQGITIDITQIYFQTPVRRYRVVDAPGHREFLKNMVSGSSSADTAVLVVDAKEGVTEQTRRHCQILRLLGMNEILVAVNKMDLVAYSPAALEAVRKDLVPFLEQLGIRAAALIPISARSGKNISSASPEMPWHGGPSLLGALDALPDRATGEAGLARFNVQDVYKFDQRRILAGRLESGRLSAGQQVRFFPSGQQGTIASIERWNAEARPFAVAGESIGITLREQLFLERGQIMAPVSAPLTLEQRFEATVFWMGKEPAKVNEPVTVELLSQRCEGRITAVHSVTDGATLAREEGGTQSLFSGQVGEITLTLEKPLAFDPFSLQKETGRFVLLADGRISGGGIIRPPETADQEAEARRENARRRSAGESNLRSLLKAASWRGTGFLATFSLVALFTRDAKIAAGVGVLETVLKLGLFYVHERIWNKMEIGRRPPEPVVLWFTGLPSAGKTTLATEIVASLRARNLPVEHLDGDTIRNLFPEASFTREGRNQHLKRVGHLASRLEAHGVNVIASFVSPYEESRQFVRKLCRNFVEVHVSTPLEVAEARDVKGLYAKARRNEIAQFTGVSDVYEPPENPEIEVNTAGRSKQECVAEILQYLEQRRPPSLQ